MDFFVWLILFVLFSVLLPSMHYWGDLFAKKDSFTREELTDVREIMEMSFREIEDKPILIGLFAAGSLLAWLVVLFGGLLSPDLSMASDFAEDTAANYFFQSFLFPVLLSIVLGGLTDAFPDGIINRIAEHRDALVCGLSISMISLNLSSWGIHHQMNFLFLFLNSCILFVFALYRMDVYIRKMKALNSDFKASPSSMDFSADPLDDEDFEV